ncbi:MAG: CHAT domain-containing protein [Capsulimonadales bacterium]|nr:CHAT domain-containing protein [Capsulimonadales bacterium]
MNCSLHYFVRALLLLSVALPLLFAVPLAAQVPPVPPVTPEVQALLDAGMKLRGGRQFAEAEQEFRKALALARQKDDKRGVADSLRRLGSVSEDLQRRSDALTLQEQALVLYRELNDRRSQAGTLSNIAGLYRRMQQGEKAIDRFRQALTIFREIDDRFWVANTLHGMGITYNMMSRPKEAIAVYEEALSLFRKEKTSQSQTMEASVLTNLGNVYVEMGETQRAAKYYEEALPLHRTLKHTENVANTLGGIAAVCELRGEYAAAIAYNREALSLVRQLNLPEREQALLLNLGKIYFETRRLGDADAHVRNMLEICQRLKNRIGEGTAWQSIGAIRQAQGDYLMALDGYLRALALFQETGVRNREGDCYRALGNLYGIMGQLELAQDRTEKALVIARETNDGEAAVLAARQLGNFYLRDGETERAMALLNEGLRNAEILQSKKYQAHLFHLLGTVNRARKRTKEGVAAFDAAIRLCRSLGDVSGMGGIMSDRGALLYQSGQLTAAIRDYEASLRMMRSRAKGDPWALALTHTRLGIAYEQRREHTRAKKHFEEAISLSENISNLFGNQDEVRLSLQGTQVYAHQYYLEFLIRQGQGAVAFPLVQRMKGRVLLDHMTSGRPDILTRLTDDERAQLEAFHRQAEKLSQRMMAESLGKEAGNRGRYAELAESLSRLESERTVYVSGLMGRHPEMRRLKPTRNVSTAEIAAALPRDGALVEFVVLPERLLMFVVTRIKNRPVRTLFSTPIAEEALTEKISDFRATCADPRKLFKVKAQELYRLLLGPADALLRHRKHVVICPDQRLWEVSFASLMPEPDRFLADRSTLSFAYSAATLLTAREKRLPSSGRQPTGTVLTVANPHFGPIARFKEPTKVVEAAVGRPIDAMDRTGNKDNYGVFRDEQRDLWSAVRTESLAPLKGTLAEAGAIRAAFPDALVLSGEGAQETIFKEKAGQYRYLHLASHAFLNDAAPLLSNIVLAEPAKGSADDGLLTAREILELDLQAEMCVLSACNTGGGKQRRGEGVIGLTWALFAAGIPTQIASQWSVDDTATGKLMSRFYGLLKTSSTKADALRAAARGLKSDPRYRHPYYWAPFVLIGDWR